MKSILIRNIDEQILLRLKKRAKHHHRSLQGELHAILEKASLNVPEEIEMEELKLKLVNTELETTWSRGEIYGDNGR